jgi:hypothetical protein
MIDQPDSALDQAALRSYRDSVVVVFKQVVIRISAHFLQLDATGGNE